MLERERLRGVCAMLPSFTTADGGGIDATDTVDTAALTAAVDRIIADGVDVIATTGSFGEVYNLLPAEQQTLIEAAVAAVRGRVPLIAGCTAPNPRETLLRARLARDAGADGILVGVPYYIPQTVDNAVQFFLDLADRLPDLAIMLYHNPTYHHFTIPVPAFEKLLTRPNIMAMKDSHRDTRQFVNLTELAAGRLQVFVNQGQLFPYAFMGAAGLWSLAAWMGPWPLLALRDACAAGDWEAAKRIHLDIGRADRPLGDLKWRESSVKLAINEAGYCHAGPLRAPFQHVPPEIVEAARDRAQRWTALAARYRPATADAAR